MYHRVTDERDELGVRPSMFRRQMEMLAQLGARVVDLVTAIDLLHNPSDRPVVGLTFDDGYQDMADVVDPTLRDHGFTGTVFLPTGIIDGSATMTWYTRQPPVLDWETIRALDASGALRMEAHSVTHPNLTRINEAAARTEITESRLRLEAQLGRPVTAFSYPAGLFGDREVDLAIEAGYTLAVTSESGINTLETDVMRLHRTQIDARDRLVDFRAKLGGGHDAGLPLRSFYRRLRYGGVG